MSNENTIFPHCIQEGCGRPFDSSIKETRPLDTLKSFWFRYCPEHRLDPKGNTNVITSVDRMDVNAKFAVPTLIENLQNLAKTQSNPVIQSRFETLALLLEHIENEKMWKTILRDEVSQ